MPRWPAITARDPGGTAEAAKGQGKVEVAVQIAQRWILARLRNQRFFSCELIPLSAPCRRTQRPPDARFRLQPAELFAEVDRPRLGALPDQPYVFARWKRCRVAPTTTSRSMAIGIPPLTA